MKYIRTTIAEPFPVLYSNVGYSHCRKARDPNYPGPFYAAGSEWFTIHSEQAHNHSLWSAEVLRKDGYTVTVDIIDR